MSPFKERPRNKCALKKWLHFLCFFRACLLLLLCQSEAPSLFPDLPNVLLAFVDQQFLWRRSHFHHFFLADSNTPYRKLLRLIFVTIRISEKMPETCRIHAKLGIWLLRLRRTSCLSSVISVDVDEKNIWWQQSVWETIYCFFQVITSPPDFKTLALYMNQKSCWWWKPWSPFMGMFHTCFWWEIKLIDFSMNSIHWMRVTHN